MKLEKSGCLGTLLLLALIWGVLNLLGVGNDHPAPPPAAPAEQTNSDTQAEGPSSEAIAKVKGALEKDLKDPKKVKLIECMGVKVYEDPQPPGHPPSPEECDKINQQYGLPSSGDQTTASSNNDDVQYDPDAAINKAKMANAEAGAITCMDRMFDGYLRMGMRSREQLLGSAANICGKVLRQFLIETGKQSPESTDAYIRVLANNELDIILRDSGN